MSNFHQRYHKNKTRQGNNMEDTLEVSGCGALGDDHDNNESHNVGVFIIFLLAVYICVILTLFHMCVALCPACMSNYYYVDDGSSNNNYLFYDDSWYY